MLLVLHGAHQSPALIAGRLEKLLRRSFSSNLLTPIFPEGPVACSGGLSRWFPAAENVSVPSPASIAQCVEVVAECAVSRAVSDRHSNANVWGIVGFSEGGALAAVLAALAHSRADFSAAKFSSSADTLLESVTPLLSASALHFLDDLAVFLRFISVAGSFWPLERAYLPPPGSIPVSSVHFTSECDSAVSSAASAELALCFHEAKVVAHDKGHVFPVKRDACEAISEMAAPLLVSLTDSSLVADRVHASELQLEELEALIAIYGDELSADRSNAVSPLAFTLARRIGSGEAFLFTMHVSLPAAYPTCFPAFRCQLEFVSPLEGVVVSVDPSAYKSAVERVVQQVCSDLLGTEMVFAVINAAQDWILEHEATLLCGIAVVPCSDDSSLLDGPETMMQGPQGKEVEELDDDLEADLIRSATKEASVTDTARRLASNGQLEGVLGRGAWDFCVGLVGKPSAGKSTFFNAAINSDDARKEAKVGAAPFTTIDPNIGRAFCSEPCPCARLGLARDTSVSTLNLFCGCGARYGFSPSGERLFPVRIKDVAGLVPGAYMGRGKGNAFLNDLLDADVLIHVVDASGTTDRSGNTDTGDPCDDIEWVRLEIHRWIADNIAARWYKVRKHPEFIYSLFSGYHATEAVVAEALMRTGIPTSAIQLEAALPHEFGVHASVNKPVPRGLVHRIVAHFLRVRFPIVNALNKCDLPAAFENISRISEKFPHESLLPLSAFSEWQMQKYVRQGFIALCGDRYVVVEGATGEDWAAQIQRYDRQQTRFGVLSALNTALRLRSPVIVYPVTDIRTCMAVGGSSSRGCGSRLADVVVMKPGSRVVDLYEALKRPPYLLLAGDFVRCETRSSGGDCTVTQKTEMLVSGKNDVLLIQTKKRAAWQKQ